MSTTPGSVAQRVHGKFVGANSRGYLDTASVGLPPDAAAQALRDAVDRWRQAPDWLLWEADGEACRERIAQLVGVAANRVSLIPAASVAAGIVAASLPPARSGANVVVYEREHQSNLFAWLSLERAGYEIRLCPLDQLLERIDDRTAIVAASIVQSADGRVVDLSSLRDHPALVYADATQAVGAVGVDLAGIDVLAFSAYKWLMCPRGIGFMVVSDRALADVHPLLASWKAAPEPWGDPYGGPLRLTPDARRFDVSLPWLLAPAALASCDMLLALGIDRVHRHDLALAAQLCRELDLPDPASPIVTLPWFSEQGREVADHHGVRCSLRAGHLRFSFHLYNDEEDVGLAADVARKANPVR